jgi:23S rRNA pseudouridine955/2504/2580 synthase
MSVQTRIVSEDEAELRLDRWFRRHFPGLPQSAIQKLCRTGQVRLDGKRAEPSDRLVAGQSVRVPPLPDAPPAAIIAAPDPAAITETSRMVLYRDDHLRFGAPDRPRLVHRLDRDTSGVIVIARSPGVAARIAAAFRGRNVEKTYWAIVAGRPVPVAGRIERDLVRHGSHSGALVALADAEDTDAAHSITDYRTLDHAGRRLAWLELQPLTGRTHQLRVHCASIGAPILGDVKYGLTRNTDDRGERNTAMVHGDGLGEGLHLHARRIALPHPSGGTLTVEAPLPPHMQESFATLGFDAPAPAAPART